MAIPASPPSPGAQAKAGQSSRSPQQANGRGSAAGSPKTNGNAASSPNGKAEGSPKVKKGRMVNDSGSNGHNGESSATTNGVKTEDSRLRPINEAAAVSYELSADLANLVTQQPHGFGMPGGNAEIQLKTLEALKAVVDYSLSTEEAAMPSIAKALESAIPQDEVANVQQGQTRAGANGKRKRSAGNSSSGNKLFEPTPLGELTTAGVSSAQVWEQMELRSAKVCRLLDAVIVKDEEQNDDEEDEDIDENAPLDDLESKAKRRRAGTRAALEEDGEDESDSEDDDDDDESPEELVRSLQALSDADMRALGLDPSKRQEYEAEAREGTMGDEDEEEEGGAEEGDGEGYPGASDLSEDDEYHGKVVIERLQTEEEQLRRKAEQAAREHQEMLKRMRMMRQLRMHDPDSQQFYADDDEEEVDDGEDADYEEDQDDEEDSNEGEDSDGEDEEDGPTIRSSIFDNPLAQGSGTSSGGKVKRHAELDDDFFSIDQFNADTDDYGDKGVDLGDDVDLFKSMEGEEEEEQENPLYYADFFAPPPYEQQKRLQTRVRAPHGAQNAKQKPAANRESASTNMAASGSTGPVRKTSVRFHDEVKVRRIKARRPRPDPLGDGIFGMLSQDEEDEAEEGEEEEEDGDESTEEDDQEDSDEEARSIREDEEDEAEVESSMDVDETAGRTPGLDPDLEDDSDEEQETARRVAGDLLADESGSEEEDEGDAQLSSHERRLQSLQQEIARLEQENVAKKDWTLMGESSSRARPENSLLEEDLEFESNAKAKPVVTPETTTTLEDLIKKRILEGNFDDVQRRATLNPMDFVPSKMLELSDQKSGKSLDQVYEDELGLGDGADTRGAHLDKQLVKEHEEIDTLYDSLERQLDALSNAHYTPKAPKVSIQTMTNAPAVTLEESLPSSMSHASQLAPEEVYDAGGRHNAALEGADSELTPEEKQRRHRQLRDEKRTRNERIAAHRKNVKINREAFGQQSRGGRFAGRGGSTASHGNAQQEKDAALRKLMGNKGVSVVGKGEGGKQQQKSQRQQQPVNASHLKL